MQIEIEETPRGFSIARFQDADGNECSIQDSSLASEAAIWFGISRTSGGDDGQRMHLTQGMATVVASAIAGILSGDGPQMVEINDRYHNQCVVMSSQTAGVPTITAGVSMTRDGRAAEKMVLTACMAEGLMMPLINFIVNGSISQESDATITDLTAPKAPKNLDVKIPASMLDRTDVGETGISAQDLINALCTVLEGYGTSDLREMVGWDAAPEIARIRDGVMKQWRNPDGSPAVL